MKNSTGSALALLALVAGAAARQQAPADARAAAEAYVAAALDGKAEDAAALAVSGKSPANKERIAEFRERVGTKTLKLLTVVGSEKQDRALAVSEEVKLTRPNPDGQDTFRVVFALARSGGKWKVRDIDLRSAADAKAKVKAFRDEYDDAKDVAAKPKK